MKLFIGYKCKYIKGYKNAAIYDLSNKKVYSINEAGRKVLDKVLTGYNEKGISEMEETFINKLLLLKLLSKEYIESEFVKKTENKIKFAWLELTDKCNLNCVHCYGEFGHPKVTREKLLSLNDWINIIKELEDMGCVSVQLIGGEPMLFDKIYELINYIDKTKIKKITVFTNGMFIDERAINEFKKCNVNLRVSVYGYNEESHDAITLKRGSFIKNRQVLELLKKHEIPTTISLIVMKENEKYLNRTISYIKEMGFDAGGYDVIRPSSPECIHNHAIKDHSILAKKYYTKPEFYTSESSFFQNKKYNPCWNSKIAISAIGDVMPCVFARNISSGNVKNTSLKNLFHKIESIWSITKDAIEGCRDCEYRYACHDCRALAVGIFGEIQAKNPRCCYNPYTGEWESIIKVTREIEG